MANNTALLLLLLLYFKRFEKFVDRATKRRKNLLQLLYMTEHSLATSISVETTTKLKSSHESLLILNDLVHEFNSFQDKRNIQVRTKQIVTNILTKQIVTMMNNHIEDTKKLEKWLQKKVVEQELP